MPYYWYYLVALAAFRKINGMRKKKKPLANLFQFLSGGKRFYLLLRFVCDLAGVFSHDLSGTRLTPSVLFCKKHQSDATMTH
jgi:hypothetical protein